MRQNDSKRQQDDDESINDNEQLIGNEEDTTRRDACDSPYMRATKAVSAKYFLCKYFPNISRSCVVCDKNSTMNYPNWCIFVLRKTISQFLICH